MDDAYSPWANSGEDNDLPLPPRRPPSPPLSSPLANGNWADDGGGWGSAVDDYDIPTSSYASTSAAGFEETLDDATPVPKPGSPAAGSEKGWGGADSPELPRIDMSQRSYEPPDSPTRVATTGPTSSAGFASSPPEDMTPSFPRASPPISPRRGSAAESEKSEGGWGPHGSPELPPISSLRIEPEASADGRAGGWGGEEEWNPPDIPEPLPSFGDAFGRRTADDDEGWTPSDAVPSFPAAEHDPYESQAAAAASDDYAGSPTGRSIPAAMVDKIKDDSRRLGKTSWPGSQDAFDESSVTDQPESVLSQPPNLPDSNDHAPPITNDTPLPSLFKLTPTLFPRFKSGISETAARSAETLKGANSAAHRAAKWGVSSRPSFENEQEQTGMSQPPAVAEEAKPAPRGWFGRSASGSAKPASPKSPARVEQTRPESPDPAPTAVERFLGRFKRPTNDPVTQAPSSSQATGEQEVDDVPASWQPRDLDALDKSNKRQTRNDNAYMDEGLSDFFGDTRAHSGKLSTAEPEDDFGGLLGALSAAPKKVPAPVKKVNKALDPFDPFADGDEGDTGPAIAAPTLLPATSSRSSTPTYPSSHSRPLSPVSPHRPAPAVAAFQPQLMAPQARGVANINGASARADDDFDAFFTSVANSTKPSSAPPAVVPAAPTAYGRSVSASNRPPPAQAQRLPTISPPPRASTISPSSSSRSLLAPLAPPPPPSQPVQRGGFAITPPPPPPAPTSRSNAQPLPPALSAAPMKSTAPSASSSKPSPSPSGPLSKDDFAFFEM